MRSPFLNSFLKDVSLFDPLSSSDCNYRSREWHFRCRTSTPMTDQFDGLLQIDPTINLTKKARSLR